jgi:hypothetical protein
MQGIVSDEQHQTDQKEVKERLAQPPPQPRRLRPSRQCRARNGFRLRSRSVGRVL